MVITKIMGCARWRSG